MNIMKAANVKKTLRACWNMTLEHEEKKKEKGTEQEQRHIFKGPDSTFLNEQQHIHSLIWPQ
jgi:hypothetical protein